MLKGKLNFFLIISIICSALMPLHLQAKDKTKRAPSQVQVQTQADDTQQPSADPVVKITLPKSYYTRKVFLFPFELPSYVMQAVTWPIGKGLKYAEKTHAIDKALDLLSNKDKTFWVYPVIEGGAGSGFGGGIGLRHTDLFHKGYLLAATYRIHVNMNQRAAASFGKPNAFTIGGKPVSYSFGANWQRWYQTDYFGIGNDSSQANRSNYDYFDINTGFTMVVEPLKNFSISPYIGYDTPLAQSSDGGGFPGAGTVFPTSETEGISTRLQYFDAGLRFAHDTRDSLDLPERGGLRSLTYHHFFCMNKNGFDYGQIELDVRHYIKLWKPRQVLALHTSWKFQEADGSDNIPFYRLATLDVNSPLRGFINGRFHDRNYALFNVEYRFPVWHMVDGVIFCDTGRVFHTISDFSFANFKYSAGGGLKIRIPDLAMFRFEAAYGGEGINLIFGASRPL